jgi:hypothetical protein
MTFPSPVVRAMSFLPACRYSFPSVFGKDAFVIGSHFGFRFFGMFLSRKSSSCGIAAFSDVIPRWISNTVVLCDQFDFFARQFFFRASRVNYFLDKILGTIFSNCSPQSFARTKISGEWLSSAFAIHADIPFPVNRVSRNENVSVNHHTSQTRSI